MATNIMSVGIVCVKVSVDIYKKFKFFSCLLPDELLPVAYLLYKTDATGHEIKDVGIVALSRLERFFPLFVDIYKKFKFFSCLLPDELLPVAYLLYKTDATGHEIKDVGIVALSRLERFFSLFRDNSSR
ncbi:MAG: hypothetical protein F6K07_08290 [Okeania sp. SIO1H5]|nr:hypothetical protein [Okeania sp. SIO1F9]NET19333.1 hypothetical protein [Okeania sp. SIO1H5]